jgi:S-adenosylmethionine synthetase
MTKHQTTKHLYPAEFVFPGHPDKLCDAIADALVEEGWKRDPRALVGVEVGVHRDHVYITGRLACPDAESIDLEGLVREVYRSAGYDGDWYPSPGQVKVVSNLCLGPLEEGEAEFRELSDDQAICVGYANSLEATNHLPVEQWLVERLVRRLHRLRRELPELQLGPDGKVMIIVDEEGAAEEAQAWRLHGFSCSLQQKTTSDEVALHRAVRVALEEAMAEAADALDGLSAELPEQVTVNGAGAFEVGGPEGDNGLSGKKLVMDAYGPRVPIGGGAWSGKDFFKADRAGGLHARRVAKTLVRLGLAKEATVTLGWFPGDRVARLISVTSESGQRIETSALARHFDLSLRLSGVRFAGCGLKDLSKWGHFFEENQPWELTFQC